MRAAKSINKSSYLGNPKLKKAGVKLKFTPRQVEELVKCSQDPMYFIKKYVKIIDQNKGFVFVEPYPYQETLVDMFNSNRFSLVLCSRRAGKTTAYLIYLLWYVIFNEHKNVYILAKRAAGARSILSRIKEAYESLPMWLQVGVQEWNKGSIELENKSKIIADSTSSTAARGENVDVLVLDEFAFVANNIQDEFYRSVYPTITAAKESKVIIVSTPNGMNLFHQLWENAKAGRNEFKPFMVRWQDVPGRDEQWVKETIANMGEEKFKIEYELDFIGSVENTLVSSSILKNLSNNFIPPISSIDSLDVYHEPRKETDYVLTVDVGRGSGLDYSAFTIFDISSLPYKICAKCRSNTIPPMEFPGKIVAAARKFNDATMLIELNDSGGQVADIIKHDYNYYNMFTTIQDKKTAAPRVSFQVTKKHKLGVTTSKTVKNTGCINLKGMIEKQQIILNDYDIISELSTFSSSGSSFAAEKGAHDDLVMNLVLFAWLTGQRFFKDISKTSIRKVLQEKFEIDQIKPILGEVQENQIDIIDPGDCILVEEQVHDWNSYTSTYLNNYLRNR